MEPAGSILKAIPGPRPYAVGPARNRTLVPISGTCQSPAHASSQSSAFASSSLWQSIPQCQEPLAAERCGVQFIL
jgi:hypothetical protein